MDTIGAFIMKDMRAATIALCDVLYHLRVDADKLPKELLRQQGREKMCRIKCGVEDGLFPTEKIARIETYSGECEEVSVLSELIVNNTVAAELVTHNDEKALIELPQESTSGKWRVWVKMDNVRVEGDDTY